MGESGAATGALNLLMSYKFHHRQLGLRLFDDKTLAQQGVVEGDVLRIQPEITAGR